MVLNLGLTSRSGFTRKKELARSFRKKNNNNNNNKKLKVVKEYRFLGVIIDNQLRFNAHVNQIVTKCKKRNNILRCLAGKDWGQSLDCQLSMYFTYIRSALEYASPSWYPWITHTAKLHLEQLRACSE